ncbi:hypothetical protein PHLGIDRAFT_280461 [Phlebiopsis gigantea 11061_1 CR5-6]|uniref:Uncharacterized protein n=1 Tax=Phlebiopsis gigantea (strain 11061_1 CR5-6) TaxID=745531 RepID=A0A0C3SDW4_PHLG1|nr:hypothetical protein PHLGIDRAFT_280461 [Phlebiopsis gigantea 11061_1 CR5-6]
MVKVVLFLFLGLSVVSSFVVLTLTVPKLTVIRFTFDPRADVDLCIPTHYRPYSWVCWLPFIILESTFFFLALGKGINLWLAKDEPKPRLLVILLRDSTLAFGGVVVLFIPNLVLWVLARQTVRSMLIGTVPTVQSVIGSRILLNIYETTESKNCSPSLDDINVSIGPTILPS